MAYEETKQIIDIIGDAHTIVIMQADNPDGDSMGSALALEQVLADLGKEPHLYCGVIIPTYLRYLKGWDRVTNDLPPRFDAAIIVDTSADSLFEHLDTSRALLRNKPCIIIDHHDVKATIPFADVVCNQEAVATGEVIYELAEQAGWTL